MNQINETSVSGETICPYCGYENANDEYESRGEYEITWRGKKIDGYINWSSCPLCGWEMIRADNNYDNIINDFIDSVTDKELGISKDDFENEDSYDEARIEKAYEIAPPDRYKIKPKSEIVKLAKQVIKSIYNPFQSNNLDTQEKMVELFFEVTRSNMPAKNDVEQKEILINFRKYIIRELFNGSN